MIKLLQKTLLILCFSCHLPSCAMQKPFLKNETLDWITKSYLAISPFLVGYLIKSLPSPWYLNFINYTQLTSAVDCVHYIKRQTLFTMLHFSSANKKQKTEWMKQQLLITKLQLLAEEQSLTNDILKLLSIDSEWYTKEVLTPWLNLNKKIKTTPQKPVEHDANLDEFTLENTKRLLRKNGVNPDCYKIKYANIENCTAMQHSAVITIYPKEVFKKNSNFSSKYECHFINNPSIEFNSTEYDQLHESDKLAVISHEVAHTLYNHNEKQGLLKSLINKKTNNLALNEQLKNKLNELVSTHEKQAEIFPALNSPSLSFCAKNLRKTVFYTDRLYVAHYNQLCDIHDLHSVHGWILLSPEKKPINNRCLQKIHYDNLPVAPHVLHAYQQRKTKHLPSTFT